MSPQPIKFITEKMKKEYIQVLETSIHLKKQKILEYQNKIKSEINLSFLKKKSFLILISRLKKVIIPKQTEMLIRLKNGESSLSDLKSIKLIMNYVNEQSKFRYREIDQLASNFKSKSMRAAVNIQYSQLNQSDSSAETAYQQAEEGSDEMINLWSSFEKNLLSDVQTEELVAEYLMSDSDFDDIVLTPSSEPRQRCQNWEENKHKKKDIIENEQIQELQTPQLGNSKPFLLSHSQQVRIIQLVDSSNNYDLERLCNMQDEADNENDSKSRRKRRKRISEFKLYLKDRMDLLNRFKEGNVALEESDRLVRISNKEAKRLQNFVNAQELQSNHPESIRSDTSKPVSEIEQLKASMQQLNKEEE